MTRSSDASAAGASAPVPRLGDLLAVLCGGVVGTAARAAMLDAFGSGAGLAVANLLGALLLGALLGSATGSGTPLRRRLSLALSTGLCGALTSFSALVVPLASTDAPLAAAALVLAQILLGVAVAALGFVGARAAAGSGART